MKRLSPLRLAAVCMFLALLAGCTANSKQDHPHGERGVFDARDWDFRHGGTVLLDGEWDFVFGAFLRGAELDTVERPMHIALPSSWREFEHDGKSFPYTGFATYRLKILLPQTSARFALLVPYQGTAYRLYVNGILHGEVGGIATDADHARPEYKTRIYEIRGGGDTLDVAFWVSNYHWWRGGLFFTPEFGERGAVQEAYQEQQLIEYGTIGANLVIVISMLIFYFMRRQEKAALYLAAMSLLSLFRVMASGARIGNVLVPSLPWEIDLRIELISVLFIAPLIFYFVAALFPGILGRRFLRLSLAYSILLGLGFLIPPMVYGSHLVPLLQLSFLVVFLVNYYAAIRAMRVRAQGSFIFLCGNSFVAFVAVLEILYHNDVVQFYIPASIGLLGLFLSQLFVLALRYETAFERIEHFSEELQATVDERTREIRGAQEQLVQSEKLASLGQLTAGIAHEIKNPLNFVNNFANLSVEMLAELRTASTDAEREAIIDDLTQNISKIEEHGKRADSIVHSMMMHARSGSGEREETDINQLLHETAMLTYHSMKAIHRDCAVSLDFELTPELPKITVMRQEIGRVFLNVIQNGMQAMRDIMMKDPAFIPHMKISTARSNGDVEVRIRDNGPGIPAEIRDRIFQPFFTTKPAGEGTGLGLSMSHDIIVKGHGGVLAVHDADGGGTEFVIRLPV